MRISRGCYDKYHRCPGWAGGGNKYAKVDRCNNGRLIWPYGYDDRTPVPDDIHPLTWEPRRDRLYRLKFRRCDTCDGRVLPSWTRWLDPTWLWWAIPFHVKSFLYDHLKRF